MPQDNTPATDTETRHNAVLTTQNPLELLKELPPSVFPVEARLSIPQSQADDTADEDYRKPEYPVDVHHSSGVYIPDTTIHFDNPAQRPPEGSIAWRPQDFLDQLRELLDSETCDDLSVENVSLSRLVVVEVPPAMLTTDSKTGDHVVKPNLYSDEFEMTIARFQKHNSLSAAHVRNELSDALPGESRTPVRLTELHEVTAKPARHGDHTTGSPGRKRYYTDVEAEKTGELDRTPAHYQSRYIDKDSERSRPLSPVLSDLEKFIPELLRESDDLIQVVQFVGHETERRSFVAEEIRQ